MTRRLVASGQRPVTVGVCFVQNGSPPATNTLIYRHGSRLDTRRKTLPDGLPYLTLLTLGPALLSSRQLLLPHLRPPYHPDLTRFLMLAALSALPFPLHSYYCWVSQTHISYS